MTSEQSPLEQYKARKIAELNLVADNSDTQLVAFLSQTIDELYRKTENGICTICGNETNQMFGIDFCAISLCENCEAAIVKQSITDKYTKI